MLSDLFSVAGRTALVTGASRGIGARIATVLDAAGAKVVLAARSGADLDRVRGRFANQSWALTGDLSEIADCEATIAEALRLAGRIDILVNCAGAGSSAEVIDVPVADWDRGHALNLRSAFILSKGLAPAMIAAGGGKIVNIASVMSFVGNVQSSVYTSSKAGMMGLTRAMAVEWARKGIQVNALCPGWIATDMVTELRADDRFEKRVINRTPARRWGEPADLDGALLFLASNASNFMTGQSLVVDGGLLASW
jgi:NAD(P)-dependent dehydrogenase (short-subunit alcohol dehydrogenase family)